MSNLRTEKQTNLAFRCKTAEQFKILAGVADKPGQSKYNMGDRPGARTSRRGGGDGGGVSSAGAAGFAQRDTVGAATPAAVGGRSPLGPASQSVQRIRRAKREQPGRVRGLFRKLRVSGARLLHCLSKVTQRDSETQRVRPGGGVWVECVSRVRLRNDNHAAGARSSRDVATVSVALHTAN